MGKNRITRISIFSLFIILLISLLFAENTEKEFHDKFKKTKINISFKGTDIDDVIKIFAEKMKVNIIRNENVKARITANLKNINIIDALDIICRTHKINYLVEQSMMSDPVIRIYTQQDYLEALMYKGTADIIKLKYSKAVDVYKKLQDSGTIKGKEGSAYGAGILYADEKSNSIIIVDKSSSINRSKIREIINAFDQPTPQVLIEAKILSVSLDKTTEFGIDWTLLWKADIVMPFAKATASDATITKTWKFKDGSGSITGLIAALGTDSDVKLLSSPRITVLNNEEAKIIVGKSEPYETGKIDIASGGAPITRSEVKFMDVGIGITVTPQINENNVILKIVPNISHVVGYEPKTGAPILEKSEAATMVSIPNKKTIILGGLIKNRKEEKVTKVPILGSIPLLKYLFSHTEWVDVREELVIFITPTIIKGETSQKKDMDKLKKAEKELND